MAAKLGGGGGGSKYDLGQNSDINVTPFVDIMLVLLIIFMVAAPMATVSIALDLPPAIPDPPNAPKPKKPVFISIQESGAIFVGEAQQTSLANLPADIPEAMRKEGVTGNFTEERVFVRADAEVSYDQFMAVLNVLQANGYFKIGLINEDIE
ncbi:MAG: biopolymer transporter ExbD [Caulobacter sp.]|nr:biopolymer transporter ExbD [Caulobacter sp.]